MLRRRFQTLLAGAVIGGAASGELAQSAQTQRREIKLAWGGRQRTAVIVLPSTSPPWPLVLMLHGAGGSTQNVIAMTGWDQVGQEQGFVAVFPNGTPVHEDQPENFLRNPQTWNSGGVSLSSGDGSATAKQVDDVGFLSALLDQIMAQHPIEARRLYVSGHSNGAGMAYRLGIERADRWAAVGVMAGHCFQDPPVFRTPVSLIQIVGDQDPFTPLAGGEAGIGRQKAVVPPALASPQKWAKALGLTSPPRIRQDDRKLKIQQWESVANGSEVESIVIKGHGHAFAWPQRPRSNALLNQMMGPFVADFDATHTMWSFFRDHPQIRT